MSSSLVSVIVPVYNSESTLGRSIESVLNQSYRDVELILVDDCSSDLSLQICNQYHSADPRITVLRKSTNSGAGESRNLGIANARGEYIAFLDADDTWFLDKIKIQLEVMERLKLRATHTSYLRNYGAIKEVRVDAHDVSRQDLNKTNGICCSSAMLRRSDVENIKMPSLRMRQDWAYWLKISEKIGTIYAIDQVLVRYDAVGGMSNNFFRLISNQYLFFVQEMELGKLSAIIETLEYCIRKVYQRWIEKSF